MTKYNAGIDVHEEGWLSLHRNENLFLDKSVLDDIVMNAVKASPVNFYPDTNHSELKSKIAAIHNVSADNIFFGNGADGILSSLFFLFRKRFDAVNLPRICFKLYNAMAARNGFKVNYFNNYPIVNTEPEINTTGLFVIDSPSSITGHRITKATLSDLVSNKNNVVVLDNVYGEFSGDVIDEFPENFILIRHFSKFYGIAGLRIGYCIASTAIIQELEVYKNPFEVNSLALFSANECLIKYDYFTSVSKEIMEQKEVFERALKSLGFEFGNSAANFLLIKHKDLSSQFINDELMKRKVATRHFSDDLILKDYLRVTVPPNNQMERVIVTLKEIIENED